MALVTVTGIETVKPGWEKPGIPYVASVPMIGSSVQVSVEVRSLVVRGSGLGGVLGGFGDSHWNRDREAGLGETRNAIGGECTDDWLLTRALSKRCLER